MWGWGGGPHNEGMRLRPELREGLKRLMAEELGPDCEVWLFGSRVDDAQRGGDIDLLVRSPVAVPQRWHRESHLAVRALRLAEGRKVDLLLIDPLTELQPIHREALATGVPL